MRSLSLKLILSYLLVILTVATLAAIWTRLATGREFDRLVLEQAQSSFVQEMARYYAVHGSWAGVGTTIWPRGGPGMRMLRNRETADLRLFALIDQEGRVVIPARLSHMGERLSETELATGAPVEVNGQRVGTVLITGQTPVLEPRELHYLAQVNRALRSAALAAGAVALLLGVLMARTLTRTLRELTAGIQAVARGKLDQRVPVRSQDELGQLAAAFNQMSAELERANQLRRQMTADIAHDLRTPLAVLGGYIESLRDGVLRPTDERFETMYTEVQHLQRLVEDLRTLSLADAGELTLNRQPVDPAAFLRRMAASYHLPAAQQEIELVVQADSGLPALEMDPERMAQVLGNLIGNALRYTPSGGRITLASQVENGSVLLAVQDSGAGIPPEALSTIFERSRRADPSRHQQDGESGLGLAIVKSIVEAQGGRVQVTSQLGRGSTFTISMPLAPTR